MTQAIAKSTVESKATLESLLSGPAFQEALQTVLPKHLTPERVVKMALVAASRQPKLWQCTKESFLQSIMKSAELGLDCSGTLGRAYLVPYFNSKIGAHECQFIAGYQGLIELARRSGNIARIESRVVHENDYFEFEYGLDQKLVHKPAFEDAGVMKCVYAIAELTDGSRQIEIMTKAEIDAIRARSKAGTSGPWVTDYSEMARKTVIRRIAKYLPLSTELEKAFEADDAMFNGSAAFDMAERTKLRAVALREQIEEPKTIVVDEETLAAGDPLEGAEPGDKIVFDTPDVLEPVTGESREEFERDRLGQTGEDNAEAEKVTKEDAAALELFDKRKQAVERFREIEKEDPEAFAAANKWLDTRTLLELEIPDLNKFFKKFG